MKEFILLQFVIQMLIICHVHVLCEPVVPNNVYHRNNKELVSDSDRIDYNEKLDYNKVKMTKLRLLLLGELFKQNNDVMPSINLTCDSGSSSLFVSTKNCSCKNYPCKLVVSSSNEISTNYNHHRRNIYTSCKDFCCTKFKRSVSNNLFNQLFSQHEMNNINKWHSSWRKVASNCGKQNSIIIPYIMHRRGIEPLCTGILISNKVILTTARCVYDTSLRDIAVKIEYQRGSVQNENVKLIRKMVHSNFKPDEGKHAYDVALLVLSKPVNADYTCLPKNIPQKLETNCHLTIPRHQININLHKITECDKILQISDIQKELYLNNGSVCGISDDNNTYDHLLGGLPLTCPFTSKSKETVTNDEQYFVRGLLTRYWPQTLESTKSAFAFVNILQYLDWINLQMEKFYL